jgi:hypothetical protein
MNKNPIFTSRKLFDELLNDGSAPPEYLWDLLSHRGGLIILLPNSTTKESESSALSVKSNAALTSTDDSQP